MAHKVMLAILGSFLAVLFVAFVAVMFSEYAQGCVGGLLGFSEKSEKNETLAFLGFAMGGTLLAVQAVIANRRAKAMEETAQAQARATKQQAKANQNTESGQRQERLRNAIEHLGHSSDSVRLGGAYELFHLAQDTQSLRQTVLAIFCAHVRRTTAQSQYIGQHALKPSEEIGSLLHLLFVQGHAIFKGCYINLRGSWLHGADLRNARLDGADLAVARLRGANLVEARLRGVNLSLAHLQSAYLVDAQLQGANLSGSGFQGADLLRAHLHGAAFRQTKLHEACLAQACLHGVTPLLYIDKPFAEHIRMFVGQESDLSGAIYRGGLQSQQLDSLVNGLSNDTANELRAKLTLHVGKLQSHDLTNSYAITGTYTDEDAEKWIVEYTGPVSEVCDVV